MIRQSAARAGRRIDGLSVEDHPALHVRRGALVLLHERAGEHHVGVARGLGEEKIDHAEELQLRERFADEILIGQGHHGVEADRQEPPDLAGVNGLQDLHRRDALAGQLLLLHAPHAGDVLPVLGVLDVAGAGELIALLPLLSPALTVALAGDHRVSTPLAPDPAAGQDEVDRGHAVLDALRVVLDPAGVEQDARLRGPPELRACTIIRAGTPAIFAATSGGYRLIVASTASQPVVCSAMKARSIHPRSIIT